MALTEKPVLYYSPMSRAETALWMNEEAGDVCDIQLLNLKSQEQKAPAFLAVNPMGKVPAMTVGDQVITEAAAICAFLADAFPAAGLAPHADDATRGAYFRWMFYGSACVEPSMLDKFSGTVRENPVSVGHGDMQQVTDIIAGAIEKNVWLLGDNFSAADVVLGSTLNFATMFGALEQREPFTAYLKRLTSRPAYIKAQEKSAAYAKELGWA